MHILKYKLKFTSDAELGTGTGSDNEDGYIPRDMHGDPYIPATHLKGIMRDELRKISRIRGWNGFEQEIFGAADDVNNTTRVNDGLVLLKDAKIDSNVGGINSRFISRTAIEYETGIAKEQSYRRTEAINKGTEFSGTIFINSDKKLHIAAVELSLLAVTNLGGTKSRGKGSCVLTIVNDEAKGVEACFNDVAKEKDGQRSAEAEGAGSKGTDAVASNFPKGIGDDVVWKRIIFTPENPICCPEQPTKTNVIKSGLAIPASAVQGAILTKINSYDSAIASTCFTSELFRTWPLHPAPEGCVESIRVSLSHKVAKLLRYDTSPVKEEFIQDSAIKPYNWRELPPNSPLKASDGVLFRDRGREGKVRLWKSSAMPRVITAHGVIYDNSNSGRRNLYQVESMAPESSEGQIVWTGIIALPENVAEFLQKRPASERYIALGRSRGVRGLGVFRLEEVESPVPQTDVYQTILITQSPIALPKPNTGQDANCAAEPKSIQQEFAALIEKWCNDFKLPALERHGDDLALWCSAGVRFGWNRGKPGEDKGKREDAVRVILPGAVFCLCGRAAKKNLEQALLVGLGEGRERGFGCLAQHIGIAEELYEPVGGSEDARFKRGSGDKSVDATKLILAIMTNNIERLPSPSQIGALQQHVKLDSDNNKAALEYLRKQAEDRMDYIKDDWRECKDKINKLLNENTPRVAWESLQMLQNLIIAKTKDS